MVCPSLSASCMYFRTAPSKPSRTHLKSVSSRRGSIRTQANAPSCSNCVTVKLSARLPASAQQHRRRRRQRFVELANRHLLQVAVVDPDACAVGDDHLLVGLTIVPAEAVRARDGQRAARFVDRLTVAIGEHLLELRLHAVEPLQERFDALPARLCGLSSGTGGRAGRPGEKDQRAREAHPFHKVHLDHSSGGAGASTSRMPFDCNGPTRPAASMVSIMRAARL